MSTSEDKVQGQKKESHTILSIDFALSKVSKLTCLDPGLLKTELKRNKLN